MVRLLLYMYVRTNIEQDETRPSGAIGGQAPDFESFFSSEYERLARFLVLVIGDVHEAEDVAQEAMVRLLEQWKRQTGIRDPRAYLYKTALNLHGRRRRRSALARRAMQRITWGVPDNQAIDSRAEVLAALEALSPNDRAAVMLVVWLGLPSKEAGDLLGIKDSSIRSRVHRARKVLRVQLDMEASE